jgi:hypothetical protein
MSDVYTFINEGLTHFSDNGGIYDNDLQYYCLKLNKLLNYVEDDDYNEHLEKNLDEIDTQLSHLNTSIRKKLFVDLSEIVTLLSDFQYHDLIDERDHYFHSIQCFLLAITLIKNFNPNPSPLHKDIVAILYSLTMYHDIGYLYQAKKNSKENSKKDLKDEINQIFADFFMCNKPSKQGNMRRMLCLTNQYTKELYDHIIEMMKSSSEIKDIWKKDSLCAQVLLNNDTGLPQFSKNYKTEHAYNGALILYKILYTKNIINSYCENRSMEISTKEYDYDDKVKWFKDIIRAISLHGMDTLSPKLNLTNDFYTPFLMIVDELQTYGRALSRDTHHHLINPKHVGFHWNGTKLAVDIITEDPKLKKECAAHDYRKIWLTLNKKIGDADLSKLFQPMQED